MNNYYMANWDKLRHIEGASQRIQEDTMRFSTTMEDLGVSTVESLMTLIAFLPVLIELQPSITELPIDRGDPACAAGCRSIVWCLFGTNGTGWSGQAAGS